ncbi:MAG: peptidoglycan-binding protein, partial [Oscillospiraceae bacterium]|nr:peptidoglycan-binding protein [Oscillospiraceae bacterium]
MHPEPFVPEIITVHLGYPSSDAKNVDVYFPDYVKNVASSEVYPTWPEEAIVANVHAIVSLALNRIFTEWYRSKGYDFDITSSTQYDMQYVDGRNIFQNISDIVDKIFNIYVRKKGSAEPYFTSFCDGRTVQCDGMSQWGTVPLAEQNLSAFDILKRYYGDNIELVQAPVAPDEESYPGTGLELGSYGPDVTLLQLKLNRISNAFPAIPKIPELDGTFDLPVENAVKAFQKAFNLAETGVVDRSTWYKIMNIYTSVTHLAELSSEGLNLSELPMPYFDVLKVGDSSDTVGRLQYYLSVIGAYYSGIQPSKVDNYFGTVTEESVKSFQKIFGEPETGEVDKDLWYEIENAYEGITEAVPFKLSGYIPLYPGMVLTEGMENKYVKLIQQYLTFINKTYPDIPAVNDTGYYGPITRDAVTAFQRHFGITQRGMIGPV